MNKQIFLFSVIALSLSFQATPQVSSRPLIAFIHIKKCIGTQGIPFSWETFERDNLALSPLLELAYYQQAYVDLWDALTPHIKFLKGKESALKSYLQRQQPDKMSKSEDELGAFEKPTKYKYFPFSDPRYSLDSYLYSESSDLGHKLFSTASDYYEKENTVKNKVIDAAITIAKQLGIPIIMGLPAEESDDDNDYLFEKHLILMTPNFDITQMVIDQLNKEWLASGSGPKA